MHKSSKPVSLTTPPAGYVDWLAELKTRIHSAQQRAALAANLPSIERIERELVRHDGFAQESEDDE